MPMSTCTGMEVFDGCLMFPARQSPCRMQFSQGLLHARLNASAHRHRTVRTMPGAAIASGVVIRLA